MEPLVVDSDSSGSLVLHLCGELDSADAGDLTWQALAVLDASNGDLIVDLSGVRFLDSTTLGALMTIRNAARAQDRALIVRNPQDETRRIFEITDLLETFGIA